MNLPEILLQTPYLTSTLPPPPELVDSNMSFDYPVAPMSKEKLARHRPPREESMDIEMGSEATPAPGAAGPSSSGARIPKPPAGEVKWWSTGSEVDRDGQRDWYYGWTDMGGELK